MAFLSGQILTAAALNNILATLSQLQAAGPYSPGGNWDPSTGSFPAGSSVGDVYIATGAGIVDGITFVEGDEVVSLLDNAPTDVYSGNWLRIAGAITRAQIEAALGAPLVGSAFVDTTDASNIDAGTLAVARLPSIPMDLVTGLAETFAAIAAIKITGGGLAQDGGDLTADRIITVPKSTQAQAEAGTDDATAMTPARVKDAIDALAGAVSQAWETITATPTTLSGYGITDALSIGSVPVLPGGRLGIISGQPTWEGDNVVSANTMFYTPYLHSFYPWYDGSKWQIRKLAGEINQALSDASKSPAAAVNNTMYDWFLWNDGGTDRCTRGFGWASESNRGVGAGTTELVQQDGIWVNKYAITNGPAAKKGTYVGSAFVSNSTTLNFRPIAVGTGASCKAYLDIWNMYNRVRVEARSGDTANNWTYASTVARPRNGNANAMISFVSGFPIDSLFATNQQSVGSGGSGGQRPYIGIGVDSIASATVIIPGSSTPSEIIPMNVALGIDPLLGHHYASAMEKVESAATVIFYNEGRQLVLDFWC